MPDRGRWYQFEQRETFYRPVYVKAASLAEARAAMHGGGDMVSDYSPSNPVLEFGGRGKIAPDQEYVDQLAEEGARHWDGRDA